MLDLPYYTSPEDLGKNANQDESSDIWGIGVILYNLLSGKQPFQGEEIQEVENNIITQKVSFDHDEF